MRGEGGGGERAHPHGGRGLQWVRAQQHQQREDEQREVHGGYCQYAEQRRTRAGARRLRLAWGRQSHAAPVRVGEGLPWHSRDGIVDEGRW